MNKKILVGKVTTVFGIKGEVKIESYCSPASQIEKYPLFDEKDQKKLIDTHYNPKDMDRRLKNYRFDNESKYGDFSCVDFFLQNSVKKLSLNCYKKQNEILESVKVFIERDGSINNYIDSHISSENSFSEHLKTNMVVKEKTTDYKNRVNEFYEKLQKNEVFNYNKEKMEELKAKERNILEEKLQQTLSKRK